MRSPKGRGATVLFAATVAALALSVVSILGYVPPADDEIPGIDLPASPFVGSLIDTTAVGMHDAPQWDFDDVFAVRLAHNERIDVTMTPAPAADFDLFLFSRQTGNLTRGFSTPSLILAASENASAGAAEKITFVSDRSGPETYCLDVAAMYYSEGPYSVQWVKTQLPAPSIRVTAPAETPGIGAKAVISGTAMIDTDVMPRPLAGFTVHVMARPTGATTWSHVATTKTTTDGAFTAVVNPVKRTKYYAKTLWGYLKPGDIATGHGTSPSVAIAPRAYLAFLSTPKAATARKPFSVTGVIRPSHRLATSRHVALQVYRHDGSRYVFYKSFWMGSSGAKWQGKLSLPKGRYRFRPSCGADVLHASAYGAAYRYLTVR